MQQEQQWVKSSQQLGDEFGVSSSTIERVHTIMEQGTPEQIQSMRDRSMAGEKPGIRTMYEQVQNDKLKREFQAEGSGSTLFFLSDHNS